MRHWSQKFASLFLRLNTMIISTDLNDNKTMYLSLQSIYSTDHTNLHVTESKPKLNPDLLSGFTAGLLEWTKNKPKVNTQ